MVGYSVLSHPLATGVETTATTDTPRNGVPSLSTKVPPTVLVAKYHPLCWWPGTIPVAWLEVPPLRSGLSTTHCAGGVYHPCGMA